MGAQQLGLNAPQADAMRALGNMADVADAAGDRVQRSNDQVFAAMKTALEQSEKNNKLLSQLNVQLISRMETLEKNFKELETTRKVEKKALEDLLKASQERMDATTDQLKTKFETEITNLTKRFNGHTHCIEWKVLSGNNDGSVNYGPWKYSGGPNK